MAAKSPFSGAIDLFGMATSPRTKDRPEAAALVKC